MNFVKRRLANKQTKATNGMTEVITELDKLMPCRMMLMLTVKKRTVIDLDEIKYAKVIC